MPTMCTSPIMTVTPPPTSRNDFADVEPMKGSVDCDGGDRRRNQLAMIMKQQISMIVASQNGQAPPPGPSSSIQPTGSSALFHIR